MVDYVTSGRLQIYHVQTRDKNERSASAADLPPVGMRWDPGSLPVHWFAPRQHSAHVTECCRGANQLVAVNAGTLVLAAVCTQANRDLRGPLRRLTARKKSQIDCSTSRGSPRECERCFVPGTVLLSCITPKVCGPRYVPTRPSVTASTFPTSCCTSCTAVPCQRPTACARAG